MTNATRANAFNPLLAGALACALASTLAGCATTPLGPTVQVMPGRGKTFDAFQADNTTCRQFAGQQVAGMADQANQRAVAIGVLTTAVGAATGAALGGGDGAAAGAGVGAAIGSGVGSGDNAGSQYAIQAQYDAAFSQCMYAKGDQVPGYAPYAGGGGGGGPVSEADPMVRSVQRELIRLRYLGGGADGVQGPRTSSAISSFESDHGMSVDGDASPRLLSRLRDTNTPSAAVASAPKWVAPAASPSSHAAPAVQPAADTTTAAAPAWVAPVSAAPASAAPASGAAWVAPVKTQ